MNKMQAALKMAGIKPTDFQEREIDQKRINIDMEIEFLEKWYDLLKRNAPDKEKHNFAVKNGFVSEKQLCLHLASMNEVHELRFELDEDRHLLSPGEIAKREKEIEEKQALAEQIKNESYYKIVLRMTGHRDITPYGEDILRRRNF